MDSVLSEAQHDYSVRLGNRNSRIGRRRDNYYFRVGYCPAVIEGDFIKAMTLLVPGYIGTPEYGTILRSSLGRDAKRQMITDATQMTMARLIETGERRIGSVRLSFLQNQSRVLVGLVALGLGHSP